jgi:signal transduction histidine kinase
MSLQRALFTLIAVVLIAGVFPAAIAVDRRVAAALEKQTREDLGLAPALLKDRRNALNDALMMHAMALAATPDVKEALASGNHDRAERALAAVKATGGQPLLVRASGDTLVGMLPPESSLEETRAGQMPVAVIPDINRSKLITVALAPVKQGDVWIGAAGVVVPFDSIEARTLAGLTRSEIIVVGPGVTTTAGSLSAERFNELVFAVRELSPSKGVEELKLGPSRYLAVAAALNDSSRVIFVRDMERELALVPQIRQVTGTYAGLSLVVALLLGALFAALLSQPVKSLAAAAARLAAGDFDAPLVRSRIKEVDRVSRAFDAMRRALAARLADLQQANQDLADRQQRLVALQAELIQRDRLAAAGRLVAQLAHEIRNPVANVRNCLEIVRRRVANDPEGREFADLAINELLRMHELAEQMLDLHRPRDPSVKMCDAVRVSRDVAALISAGAGKDLTVKVTGESFRRAAMAPDALKQVLLNLTQNAREAMNGKGTIELKVGARDRMTVIDVVDSGPGIPANILPNIFDPFFTTKVAVHGVGLGLFVAEGIVRSYGGELTAGNRPEGGARFSVVVPSMPESLASSGDEGASKSLASTETAQ